MKTALVTGGARRIGAAVAKHLAFQGFQVAVHCHGSVEESETLVRDLVDAGKNAFWVQGDLSKEHTAHQLIGEVKKKAGRLDVLVNNASIFNEDTVLDFSFERLMENTMVNTYAPLLLSRIFASDTASGCVVNFLDSRVVDYDGLHASYHLSKRTFDAITKMLALELAPKIRVNAVAPGLILPPEGKGAEYVEMRKKEIPLGRQGTLDEICLAVDFLLHNEFVTGQTIFVDGGRHLTGAFYR